MIAREVPTFYFIGVTTGSSSIMKVFPSWARELGRPEVAMLGVDLKLHDEAEAYRQAVAQIKFDPNSLGALVTTHKIDLYEAARDMFDFLDLHAQTCGEVSCISKRDGALEGHAKDPITSGLTLDGILGEGYFAHTGGDVLCFGSGGAATAIALCFAGKSSAADRPRRFTLVDRSPERLDRLKRMLDRRHTDVAFDYFCNDDPERNDALMQQAPEGTLVINATGMGKDLPGSPITDRGLFPRNGIAWELNYRGEIYFLRQARSQRESRNVRGEDGWVYFLHGWTQVISQVFHIEISGELFDRLAAIAKEVSR
ncbi:MAG: shikimate dehydrogenase [Chloroflexi bacterium]|nr:shikimate dehydrogenase [Chloroflexota bacterium]